MKHTFFSSDTKSVTPSWAIAFGFNAALIVTLYDFAYIFSCGVYIPPHYPALLFIFNCMCWSVFGFFSGRIIQFIARRQIGTPQPSASLLILLTLFPFLYIYGTLGRLYISLPPPPKDISFLPVISDHHFSYIWVFVILALRMLYEKKQVKKRPDPPGYFSIEIFFSLAIFNICSNESFVKKIQSLAAKAGLNFEPALLAQYLVPAWILCAYLLCLFISHQRNCRNKKRITAKRYLVVLLAVIFILASYYKAFTYHTLSLPAERQDRVQTAQNAPVILILLDCVRSDRMSPYGYHAKHPTFERFVTKATLYENCIAPSSWTLPSHASLFTGLYPSQHGARKDERISKAANALPYPLSRSFTTLAEVFKENGYGTAAVVGNSGFVNTSYNLDQGFVIFNSTPNVGLIYSQYGFRPLLHIFSYLTNIFPEFILPFRNSQTVNREAEKVLAYFKNEPFFLFINYNDAHEPYAAQRPFSLSFLKSRLPRIDNSKGFITHFSANLTPEKRYAYLQDEYDYIITYLDKQVGNLFKILRAKGLYDKSFIIITSDHGQLLGEHDKFNHGGALYNGVIKVPLMIKTPFQKTSEKKIIPLMLTDLYKNIIAMSKLSFPDKSSATICSDNASFLVSEVNGKHVGGKNLAIFSGRYKYMFYKHWITSKLFDLETDPDETINLANRLPAVKREMELKLKNWRVAYPFLAVDADRTAPLSDDTLMNLKALGYIK